MNLWSILTRRQTGPKSRTTSHIQPGKPRQNAHIDPYNRTVRGEWLSQYILATVGSVQDQATEWTWPYNNERPKNGIGGITHAMKLKAAD